MYKIRLAKPDRTVPAVSLFEKTLNPYGFNRFMRCMMTILKQPTCPLMLYENLFLSDGKCRVQKLIADLKAPQDFFITCVVCENNKEDSKKLMEGVE